MKFIDTNHRIPIISWCDLIEEGAMKQAANLAALPFVFRHVALMADCHQGFGMPIGGGNHFIEIQGGDDGHLWLMIHSGSRNFGYKIARYYHEKALAFCDKRRLSLPDRDLAYLPMDTKEAGEYKMAMDFALLFARANRDAMKRQCVEIMERITRCRFLSEVNIHHNYAAQETHFGRSVIVHRKGATSARNNETGIIPGSMGTASYIVNGLGNPESFQSCSHGAGRAMSRNEANRRLSLEDVRRVMKGVIFEGWKSGKNKKLDLSEAPQAYKNIESVIEAQKDLVEVKVRLMPLGVMKG
jgi:tRNA-splicing ligase RtcB (3'-phosphate/5'-hydroxy nucleic acid ligase)